MRAVAAVWPLLPAFRAVGETEHLGRAAALLQTSPPALSRAIRQLEAALGHPLFSREGRGLQLNARGRELLDRVRDAMRIVDDGLGKPHQRRPELAVARALTSLFPAATVVDSDPHLALQSGRVDVCLWLAPSEGSAVVSNRIASLEVRSGGVNIAQLDVHAWRRKRLTPQSGDDPALELVVTAARVLRGMRDTKATARRTR